MLISQLNRVLAERENKFSGSQYLISEENRILAEERIMLEPRFEMGKTEFPPRLGTRWFLVISAF